MLFMCKHLLLAFYLGIIFGAVSKTAGEIILLQKHYDLYCVSNDTSGSALAWTLPLTPNNLKYTPMWKTTKPVEKSNVDKFRLDLKENKIPKNWEGGTVVFNDRVENYDFGPVTDYRWNYFRTHYSINTAGYVGLIPITFDKTAKFHISVLARNDAYILLSEHSALAGKPVYVIVLDNGQNLFESFILKCSNQATGPLLHDGLRWVHLSVELTRSQAVTSGSQSILKITVTVHGSKQTSLSWEDKDGPYDVKYLNFKNGYFKFHQYQVYKADLNSSSILSPRVKFTNPRHLCLAVIYHTQQQATLRLLLAGRQLGYMQLQAGLEWQVARFEHQLNASNDRYQIVFNYTQGSHFYLGDVRNCSDNDVFTSKIKTSYANPWYKCEELKTGVSLERGNKQMTDCYKGNGTCNTVSCNLLVDSAVNCQSVTACGENSCSCLPGYHGPSCDQTCVWGYYGPGCKERCGKCLRNVNCDKVNGTCSTGCNLNWRAPLCKKELPRLDFQAADFKVSSKELTLEINKEKSYLTEEGVQKIILQYKGKDQSSWMNESFEWPQMTPLTLQNLTSFTEYEVRVLLVVEREQYHNNVTIVSVKTACAVINHQRIIISANLSEVTVNWFKMSQDCPLSEYSVQAGDMRYQIKELPYVFMIPETGQNHDILVYHNKTWLKTYNVKTNVETTPDLSTKKDKESVNQGLVKNIVIPIIVVCIVIAVVVGYIVWKRKQNESLQDPLKVHINVNKEHVTIGNSNDMAYDQGQNSAQQNSVGKQEIKNTLTNVTPKPMATKSSGFPPNIPEVDYRAGAKEILSEPVCVKDLEKYVEKCLASNKLQHQHSLFPRGQTQPWDYGRLPENKPKNRYGNLVAYDATRVKLELLPGVPYSDYINANYIGGYKQAKSYVATQGPKSTTTNDFWRMVWQENITLLVMLANVEENGKPKCDKYWPDVCQNKKYGDVTVQSMTEDVYADYTQRKFRVTRGGTNRVGFHLHFTSWPDHGVPHYPQSVAAFVKRMQALNKNNPVLVHCSAGVGRTGTILLIDTCLRMATEENQVDPLAWLQRMRSERPNLVDNADQYELVHLALLGCILADTFTVSCSKYNAEHVKIMANKFELLKDHYKRVNELCKRDSIRKKDSQDTSWPADKSRYPSLAPGKYGRVVLSSIDNDYINAVFVDGFRTKNQFIATQLPLTNTIPDFWHLVWQTKSPLVIVLNQPDPKKDQSTCIFWSENEEGLHLPDGSIVIRKNLQKRKNEAEKFKHIRLQHSKGRDPHEVSLLMFNGWESGTDLPPGAYDLIEFWEHAERLYTGYGPIVVMCHDGVRGCGLFLSSVFVLEKIKLEKEVDVGLAVRTARLTRTQFINSLDQYKFLHQVAMSYQDSFETYANFQ